MLSEADLEDSIIGAPLLFGFPLILVCGRVEVKREGEESGWGCSICYPSSFLSDRSFGRGCVPLTQSRLQLFSGFSSTVPFLCLTGPTGIPAATVASPWVLHHSLPVS